MNAPSSRRTVTMSMMPAALLCAATVHSAPKTLEMPREKQLHSSWCWAAVSTMAVNSFPMTLPDGSKITQRTTVILKEAQIMNQNDYDQARFDSIGGCTGFGSCGGAHDPFLYNARATRVPFGKVLTKKVFNHEIGKRKRPVIINWDYSQADASGTTPRGSHLLIITGYNPSNGKLRLFDPWPVDNGAADAPGRKRERWITYQTYLDPVMDMGQPVTAVHEMDLYQLRRFDEELPADVAKYPPLASLEHETDMPVTSPWVADRHGFAAEGFAAGEQRGEFHVEPTPPAEKKNRDLQLQRVSFAESLEATKPMIDKHVSKLVVTRADGTNVWGRKRLAAAPAFPMVTLNTAEILKGHLKPDAFFSRQTSVLLVPVIDTRAGEVIDSFLIYNQAGTWKIGGYANTEIAGVLVDQRKKLTDNGRRADEFFVVSVPEQSTFYFAHGTADAVQLASVDNRGAEFIGASDALGGLVRTIGTYGKKDEKGAAKP